MTDFEKAINYKFKDDSLMERCLIHSSFANYHNVDSNERLEFLGDSVLGLITTNYLYRNFEISEGDLSKMRANLVSADNISKIIDKLNIVNYLKTINLTSISSKIKCDLFEAIVGAIYLDNGYFSCKKFVEKQLNLPNVDFENFGTKDYKTILQEYVQFKHKKLEYKIIEKKGPNHKPEYVVAVEINKKEITRATANSKKQAEIMAAKMAIKILKGEK